MHDPSHVRLVDAHAERNRRDDDLQIVANEGVLSITAGDGVESGVIRRSADAFGMQLGSQFIDAPAR